MIEAKYVNITPLITELKKSISHTNETTARIALEIAVDYLNNLPTGEMAPVVHAKLIEDGYEDGGLVCSVCGEGLEEKMNYCFYCGAIIDRRSESDEPHPKLVILSSSSTQTESYIKKWLEEERNENHW